MGAFRISARLSPGGGGGMLNPENPPIWFLKPVKSTNPFPTIKRMMARVEIVPAAIDLRTLLAKNPPTTPATTHVIKRGM